MGYQRREWENYISIPRVLQIMVGKEATVQTKISFKKRGLSDRVELDHDA